MEPKFQTSFIPKNPSTVGSGNTIEAIHTTNLFTAIGTVVFVLTLLASGGVYAYQKVLTKQVEQAKTDLVAARDAFAPEKIQELADMSSRIASARGLLNNHMAVSEIFMLLQNLTVVKVQFTSFAFVKKDNLMSVSMDGVGQNYNALADQSEIFSKNQFIKEPQFSSFNLTPTGTIGFKFIATIDPSLVSYKTTITDLSTQ